MNNVTLINVPNLNQDAVLTQINFVTGEKFRPVSKTFAGFLSLLANIFKGITDPLNGIREAGSLLNHLQYTFLIVCDKQTLSDLQEEGHLHITSTATNNVNYVALLASGTLTEWRLTISNLCTESSYRDLRQLLNTIVKMFDGLGLSQVFFEFKRKSMSDKTFYLENKCS